MAATDRHPLLSRCPRSRTPGGSPGGRPGRSPPRPPTGAAAPSGSTSRRAGSPPGPTPYAAPGRVQPVARVPVWQWSGRRRQRHRRQWRCAGARPLREARRHRGLEEDLRPSPRASRKHVRHGTHVGYRQRRHSQRSMPLGRPSSERARSIPGQRCHQSREQHCLRWSNDALPLYHHQTKNLLGTSFRRRSMTTRRTKATDTPAWSTRDPRSANCPPRSPTRRCEARSGALVDPQRCVVSTKSARELARHRQSSSARTRCRRAVRRAGAPAPLRAVPADRPRSPRSP